MAWQGNHYLPSGEAVPKKVSLMIAPSAHSLRADKIARARSSTGHPPTLKSFLSQSTAGCGLALAISAGTTVAGGRETYQHQLGRGSRRRQARALIGQPPKKMPHSSKRGIFGTDLTGGLGNYLAAINATVVSSMRFEKPHSLSYHDDTLTNRPDTFVRVESKLLDAGLWLKSTDTSGSV